MVGIVSSLTRLAASRYIAGETYTELIPQLQRWGSHGFRLTICPWNGVDDPHDQVLFNYAEALHGLQRLSYPCYLSIKAPAFGFRVEYLERLIEIAKPTKTRIHFDAMSFDSADQTLKLIEQALPSYGEFGLTLPSRWKRSLRDVNFALKNGLAVRLIKGQFKAPTEEESDSVATFVALTERLAGKANSIAVATHDQSLAHRALKKLCAASTAVELEQLYGIPLIKLPQNLNIPIRIYIPYGQAYLPYALSQLKENPKIAWWLFRDIFLKKSGNL